MPRFFVDQKYIDRDYIRICGEDVGHIKNVLRLKIGDIITVCDGNCNEYEVEIIEYNNEGVLTKIHNTNRSTAEGSLEITLFQGLPKSDKMDFIIQKCVELGVSKIVPIMTSRTVVKLTDKKDIEKKVSRWQRIALEAAKQCNRGIIPVIGEPVDFKNAVKMSLGNDISIIPYEKENNTGIKNTLKHLEIDVNKIAVIIGPEGGFSEEEISFGEKSGCLSVSLGPRILRTETAALAAVTILMYELGDLGI